MSSLHQTTEMGGNGILVTFGKVVQNKQTKKKSPAEVAVFLGFSHTTRIEIAVKKPKQHPVIGMSYRWKCLVNEEEENRQTG